MGVKLVNFETLTKEYIDATNKQLKKEEQDLILGIKLDTKGKIKTLRLYSVELSTGERTTIYEKVYEVKNPAEYLKSDINHILYRELFYNCFVFYAINLTSMMKERAAEKAIDRIDEKFKGESMKADDAFNLSNEE